MTKANYFNFSTPNLGFLKLKDISEVSNQHGNQFFEVRKLWDPQIWTVHGLLITDLKT